jgi:hypothetical protein
MRGMNEYSESLQLSERGNSLGQKQAISFEIEFE